MATDYVVLLLAACNKVPKDTILNFSENGQAQGVD